jgi:hypothetical protein
MALIDEFLGADMAVLARASRGGNLEDFDWFALEMPMLTYINSRECW